MRVFKCRNEYSSLTSGNGHLVKHVDAVRDRLLDLEESHNITIIWASESGSRAWNFESGDSDFDVRFFYYKDPEEYMPIGGSRADTISSFYDEGLYDFHGWEISKAIKMAIKRNASIHEWLSSPIVYMSSARSQALNLVKKITYDHYQEVPALRHYVSTAKSNKAKYLEREEDRYNMKKYLYVLRPLLCCLYIMDKNNPPPSDIFKMLDLMGGTELEQAKDLLKKKKSSPSEIDTIGPLPELRKWLEATVDTVSNYIAQSPNISTEWAELSETYMSESRKIMLSFVRDPSSI